MDIINILPPLSYYAWSYIKKKVYKFFYYIYITFVPLAKFFESITILTWGEVVLGMIHMWSSYMINVWGIENFGFLGNN